MARRKALSQLHATIPTRILFPEAKEIFGFCRFAPTGPLICLFNFSEETIDIPIDWLRAHGMTQGYDHLSEGPLTISGTQFPLLPYGRVWVS